MECKIITPARFIGARCLINEFKKEATGHFLHPMLLILTSCAALSTVPVGAKKLTNRKDRGVMDKRRLNSGLFIL